MNIPTICPFKSLTNFLIQDLFKDIVVYKFGLEEVLSTQSC